LFTRTRFGDLSCSRGTDGERPSDLELRFDETRIVTQRVDCFARVAAVEYQDATRGEAVLDSLGDQVPREWSRGRIRRLRFWQAYVESIGVAGDEPMRHPCFQQPDSILEKLRRFHQDRETPVDRLLADLNAAVGQLPYNTRSHEAKIVAGVLQERAQRRRGASAIGDLLPAVLARLNVTEENKCGDRS
jgi:hypothetical protein